MTGQEARRRNRAARFVAQHWRDMYLAEVRQTSETYPWAIGTHPLAMVLSALDGVTDPAELGLNDDVRTAFEEAIR